MNQFSSHNSPLSQLSDNKPLGQLLNEAGLISAHQIEIALQEQIEIPRLKIGEIFSLRGWIKQETADFFAERWNLLLKQEKKFPLVYYLRQAALLDEKQISFLMEQRNQSHQKVRFHQVAVQHGLIKRQTIDFFIKNLLVTQRRNKSSNLFSVATPYKILQSYIRGETDFQRSELKKIKLNHVTLKGVNLDSSNLAEAELKKANLSNSSLRLSNLTGANLEKAILQKVDFECACLNQVNLTDAHLEGSNFRKANLREADLRDGYLVNVSFAGADLRSTKLQGANLKGALYDSETVFDPEFDPRKIGMELS
ncbi:MAG: pentapeptide repeat-containing protein [Cyanobacteria bacterium P01_G01_bin.67]